MTVGASVGNEVLEASPIHPSWIVQGEPVARVRPLASTGPRTQAFLWDCTAGRFRWEFGPHDETVHILEGAVRVTSAGGTERVLSVGDVAVFAAGSSSYWDVETYVKKLAVLHDTRSRGRRFLQALLTRARGAGL